MEKYDSIYRYLESGIYPEGLLKNEKRNFRRKCKENFKIEKGQLYYSKSDRCTATHKEPEWKLCVKNEDDKQRMLRSCHSSATGKSIQLMDDMCTQLLSSKYWLHYFS